MNEEESRFELYQRLLAAAAAQLGCDPSSDKAKDLACIRLMRETVTLNLIAGRNVDPGTLRWLIEELAKFAPPEPPIRVEVEIVEPQPLTPLTVTPPDRGVGFVDFTPQPAEAAPTPVAVHPDDLPRRDPGSIHNARLPDGTPARMRGPSYAAYVSGRTTYQGGERPDFEAKHPLPTPNRGVCW